MKINALLRMYEGNILLKRAILNQLIKKCTNEGTKFLGEILSHNITLIYIYFITFITRSYI